MHRVFIYSYVIVAVGLCVAGGAESKTLDAVLSSYRYILSIMGFRFLVFSNRYTG